MNKSHIINKKYSTWYFFRLTQVLVIFFGLNLCVSYSIAQTKDQAASKKTKTSGSKKSKSKEKKLIDFEDELIQGEVKKPEMMHLFNKKQFNFKKLIKLRENFIPEMKRSAEDF